MFKLYSRDDCMGQGKHMPMRIMGLFTTMKDAINMVEFMCVYDVWPDACDAFLTDGTNWWKSNENATGWESWIPDNVTIQL